MHYYQLGKIPHKRHTVFRQPNGDLYPEQLISTEGFSNVSSLTYHLQRPTQIREIYDPVDVSPTLAIKNNMKHRAFMTFQTDPTEDFLESRTILLANNDIKIGVAAPTTSMKDYFYKNASCDEVLFIHQGRGNLRTMFGRIPFEYGDYLIIPRGTIYQLEFEDADNRILFAESPTHVRPPRKYMNSFGQLMEHSPFCERDIKKPRDLETHDQVGDFEIRVKKNDEIFPYIYATHPFDVVGWDGYAYPYGFSIHDFEPITGRVHQPPPVHQNWEGNNFVICSFCPRKFDYHPEAIPAPYTHSNVDSDELLYYVAGNFMSRRHVEKGMITLHPQGVPHGPHPGAAENSIGKDATEELAVMIDTFKPLWITEAALKTEFKEYYQTWIAEENMRD
jgi:homogentisate 1,2-dioxygenase